jgi:hypothetical protein
MGPPYARMWPVWSKKAMRELHDASAGRGLLINWKCAREMKILNRPGITTRRPV